MTLSLTKRAKVATSDLVDALAECHERIRRFVALGHEIAARTDATADLIVEACDDVERYFRVALPLHIADEEESILPRLRGRLREVDDALSRMAADHRDHKTALAALFEALTAVRNAPSDLALRATLGEAARVVDVEFREHLALEERVIFPAIRELLSGAERAAIQAEARARRSSL